MRGERAGQNHLFENVRAGKTSLSGIAGAGFGPGKKRGLEEWFLDTFPIVLLKYYPDHLKFLNQMVEIGKLPPSERAEKLGEWEMELREAKMQRKNILSALLAPALSKVNNADIRNHTYLRCAAVGLACERYRLKHQQWPKSLDVLVQERFLEAVPVDPQDNQSLRYRVTKDGVVIYSIGFDKKDDQGHIDRDRPIEPGVDLGFRLWNPGARRQPSLPPVAMQEVPN
jgi:hypothetical protein